ncbi:alpha/beta hydrolase [Actinomyces massiliensis]|uniref:Alpha/beta hydrolase family protein n=1 Tax=Actinomyces massiliensis F0489 TaxID=1125718 RepID=J1H6Y6_9ACTO|nr:alpha/beta hydrolase [Actinomyces massiliensis]EJF41365.1 alpha/beta hydrolase family protein [Actinomyces massiliensis F0489]WLD71546.1 alpha/beta hydrolase [Actinomyces massiliensis]
MTETAPTEPSGPTGPAAHATHAEPTGSASPPIPATAPPASSTPKVSTDILGEPWVARRIDVALNETAAPNADHAVLVHQRGAAPAAGTQAAPRHERAVLYLHGRNDYFFQTHLADAFLQAGYEFYALDLRTCGRAGIGHPSPHDVRDLRIHDEEIGEALRIIRSEHGHGVVVLNGHSTGGLQAVIWAADHPGTVEALVLNSPWLQLNASGLIRSYGSAYVDVLSRRSPERIIDNPAEAKARKRLAAEAASAPGPDGAEAGGSEPVEADLYVRVLHRRWGGEWDWDLRLKPSPAFPVRAGFLAGIRRLQREVRHGLGIEAPVLVCCSTTSSGPEASPEEALHSDIVLSVDQIIKRAAFLGTDVTVRQIPGGVHDLALSPSPAREEYLATVTDWLDEHLG